ncbi:MAG: S8 family serine peptidase [Deinococcales bacterium]
MSLGGKAYEPLDQAIAASIAQGVIYAVAAGNSSADACDYSPARAAPTAVLSVGSTTNTDSVSSFSNQGSCVDLFAPGSSITSAWYTSDSATQTISGTSMVSPHVAGVAASIWNHIPMPHPNRSMMPLSIWQAQINSAVSALEPTTSCSLAPMKAAIRV